MVESIGDIIRDKYFPLNPDKTFAIPRFQRGYSWTTEHVTDFLNDLDNRLDDKLPHHFGTLFLRTDDNSDEREIIDGQQRITTVVLYLVACRDFLKSHEADVTNPIEKVEFDIKYQELSNRLEPKKQPSDPILRVGKINEDLFAKLYPQDDPSVKFKFGTKPDDKLLLGAYKLIYENLKSKVIDKTTNQLVPKFWSEIVHNYTALLTQFRLAELVVNTMERAFTIFETINHRGEPLDQTDLIKNYFFHLLYAQKLTDSVLDKYAERWTDMRQTITGTSYDFDDFVKHVLFVEYNIEGKKKNLYNDLVEVMKSQKVQDVIKKLEEWAEIFEKLRVPSLSKSVAQQWNGNGTTIQSLEILNSLRAVHAYPTLMQGYRTYYDNKKYIEFEQLANLLVTIQIRTKQVMGKRPSSIWKITKEITEKLKGNKSWLDITAPIIDDHQASKVEFEAQLEKFTSSETSVVKYILVEHKKQNLPGTEVEHIMPQTIGDWQDDIIKWKNYSNLSSKADQKLAAKAHQKKYVDFIGNQMLLEKRINDSIGNSRFKDKQLEYVTSGYTEAKTIGASKNVEWSDKEILKRQIELKKTMIGLFTIT